MYNKLYIATSLIILVIVGINLSYAQVVTVNIDKSISTHNSRVKTQSARTEEGETLSLPFWDDFSWSRLVPDIKLWQDTVEISSTNGINPPTFNVATFDGIKLDGTPYSFGFGDFESGDTDVLTSQPINLSNLSSAEKNTVFLSFFYQKQGFGEQPDDEDGLRVEFLSITETDTTWQLAIPPGIIKGSEILDSAFYQIIHKVEGEEYFHNIFQFRIIATGRQTGPYDTWNVDYVYLNKGRDENDLEYFDRSFNAPISSPFKGFTSLPINHFLPIREELSDSIRSHFNTLGETQTFDFSLDAIISYVAEGVDFQYLNVMDRGNGLIGSQYNIAVVSDFLVDFSGIDVNASGATIKLKLFGNLQEHEETIPYNSQINDTIYGEYYLKDYYAYDDGTAEKGAGVNSEGDNIAVKFPFLGEETSFLKGVDIYIPQVVGEVQHGKQIKINVFSNGLNGPNRLLSSRFLTIPKIETLNEFYRVEFSNPVIVADSFYIGWEQTSSDRIFVGLDKNINSQNKIWLNTTNAWEPNNNQIEGSLMIRPYFEENAQVTSINTLFETAVNVYPNPSSRYVTVPTPSSKNITVLNLSGQSIFPAIRSENDVIVLDFDSYPSGIYIIKLLDKNNYHTQRIVLSK